MSFFPRAGALLRDARGFTLLEVALALALVGLLVGGLFGGRWLLEQSRLNQIDRRIEATQSALEAYRERYRVWPGDHAQAQALFGAGVADGNGNQRIDGAAAFGPLDAWGDEQGEPEQAWRHLDAAGLLGEGEGSRLLPWRGRLEIAQVGDGAARGLALRIGRSVPGEAPTGLLTPRQAQALDARRDTGLPDSGRIRAGTGAGAVQPCHADGRYATFHGEASCVLLVFLEMPVQVASGPPGAAPAPTGTLTTAQGQPGLPANNSTSSVTVGAVTIGGSSNGNPANLSVTNQGLGVFGGGGQAQTQLGANQTLSFTFDTGTMVSYSLALNNFAGAEGAFVTAYRDGVQVGQTTLLAAQGTSFANQGFGGERFDRITVTPAAGSVFTVWEVSAAP